METRNSMSNLQKICLTLSSTEHNEISFKLQKNYKFKPEGDVSFQNVTLRYDSSDTSRPPAVKSLCFSVKKGERIGCVGKSGAGKSTIILGLLKFLEGKILIEDPEDDGLITVDGINIKNVDPRVLRKAFGIMPQTPFIMTASIRDNLDPFQEYTDEVSI
jgi:ATP-binding cassette subfamily C (CFTR/MRP) protein 4